MIILFSMIVVFLTDCSAFYSVGNSIQTLSSVGFSSNYPSGVQQLCKYTFEAPEGNTILFSFNGTSVLDDAGASLKVNLRIFKFFSDTT